MNYYVYILASENNEKLYVGITNDLVRRTFEHKEKFVNGYSEFYNITKLVCYEETTDVMSAIEREKQIKKYRRQKKDNLIYKFNPSWEDLFDKII